MDPVINILGNEIIICYSCGEIVTPKKSVFYLQGNLCLKCANKNSIINPKSWEITR